ncbi:hypothetical protein MSTO_45470 [Mycobacterium stomatepiae]|uniref:Uncharacterized protein n=1 Tax=Mycobacterium stomatepiae TaxID=470076 RepID=A0A7I7QDY5_9MYCO|nr:hypothetical protein MSTO_45470 [Mycobacterium stomatepiae]
MPSVHSGDRARLLEVRYPVDRDRRRYRSQLLSRYLARRGLCAGGDRMRLFQQVVQLGFVVFYLRFPLGESGFVLLELGFLLAKFGFPLVELGFPAAKLGLPLGELGFVLRDLGFVLGELGLALRDLGFPIAKLSDLLRKRRSPMGELGLLVAKLILVLANFHFLPADFTLLLVQNGFALGELGFSLLEPTIAIAELGVAVPEFGVLFDVADQLLLNQVDEQVDFLLAVATLTNARPRERDIVNIGRGESHCSSPEVLDVSATPKFGALRLRIIRLS